MPIFIDQHTTGRAGTVESLQLSADAAQVMTAHPRLRLTLPLEDDQLQFASATGNANLFDPQMTSRLSTHAPSLVFNPPSTQWPSGVARPGHWLRTDLPGLVPHLGAEARGWDDRVVIEDLEHSFPRSTQAGSVVVDHNSVTEDFMPVRQPDDSEPHESVSGDVALTGKGAGTVESPGGTHSAVLFQRGCGATTGLSTQISVLPAGDQPVHEGNAFRADTGHRASVRVGAWQGPWAEMHWLSQRHLRIRYAAGARPFAQVSEVNGISISFEPVPAPSPVRP